MQPYCPPATARGAQVPRPLPRAQVEANGSSAAVAGVQLSDGSFMPFLTAFGFEAAFGYSVKLR